jgi:hypothetical protein
MISTPWSLDRQKSRLGNKRSLLAMTNASGLQLHRSGIWLRTTHPIEVIRGCSRRSPLRGTMSAPGRRARLEGRACVEDGRATGPGSQGPCRARPRRCSSDCQPPRRLESAGLRSTACWLDAARFRLVENAPKRVSPGNPRPSRMAPHEEARSGACI